MFAMVEHAKPVTPPGRAGTSEVVKLSVFVPRTLDAWVTAQAELLGVAKSTFCRMVLMQFKRDEEKPTPRNANDAE
jgi:hypothetical protein